MTQGWEPADCYQPPEDEIAAVLAFGKLAARRRARMLRREDPTPAARALVPVFSFHFPDDPHVQARAVEMPKMKPLRRIKSAVR